MKNALPDCLSDGELRAHLDGETPSDRRAILESHLAACALCRARARELQANADLTARALQKIAPAPSDDDAVWRRLRAETAIGTAASRPRSKTTMTAHFHRSWRPLAMAAVATLATVAFMTVTPLRTAAAQFLAVFRVNQIQVVTFDPDQAVDLNQRLLERMVVDEPVEQSVIDASEAASISGLSVLTPSSIPEGYSLTKFTVTEPRNARAWVDLEATRALLESAGLPTDILPQDPDARVVSAHIPALTMQQYRSGESFFSIGQVASPEMSVPEGMDMERIGGLGLRLLGYSSEQAANLASSINWATTLVLPVPTGEASAQEVMVQGVKGYVLEDRQSERYTETSVAWEKAGVVYTVSGNVSEDLLLAVARSLQ